MVNSPHSLLRAMFDAAIGAALPEKIVPRHLPAPPKGRTIVVGAGKASAAMARAVEEHWPGPMEGLVVTRYGHGVPCRHIEIVEAAHPVPDAAGVISGPTHPRTRRGQRVHDDLVLCLISGGGSALAGTSGLGHHARGQAGGQQGAARLGADIAQMNIVRKHLSAIKGGRLAAAAHPARLVSLLLSDVPGDDPSAIASGPTVPDPSTFAEASAILRRYRIDLPDSVRAHLDRAEEETPSRETRVWPGARRS